LRRGHRRGRSDAERRSAGAGGQVGGAARLLGSVESRVADSHRSPFGSLGDDQRLVDPLLKLAQQRWRRALGQQPVLRIVALGTLHLAQFTGATGGKGAGR